MKPKTKKRNREFTVRAKNDASFERIKKKAKLYGIKFYPKGKARKRVYFLCTQKTWSFFIRKIQKEYISDPPVQCPSWVQRQMFSNLFKTATCCPVAERRTRAKKILTDLGSKRLHEKILFEVSLFVWILTQVSHFAAISFIAKFKTFLANTPRPKRKVTPTIDVSADLQFMAN